MVTTRVPTVLGPIHVRRLGEGGTAVLLWHSLFVDGHSWDAVAGQLARRRTVLVVDGPDHGQSPGPASRRRYDLETCAQAASELLTALAVAEVHWVGNAWGGHVGVALAARAEPRLRSVAALCSPMQPLAGAQRLKASVLVRAFQLVGARPWLVQQVLEALTLPEVRAERPELARYISRALEAPGRARLLRAMRSVMLGRRSLVPQLPRVRVPALFVATARDDSWPPGLARAHAALLPNGRVLTLGGARHLPPLEVPDATARLLAAWLSEVEAGTTVSAGRQRAKPARPTAPLPPQGPEPRRP